MDARELAETIMSLIRDGERTVPGLVARLAAIDRMNSRKPKEKRVRHAIWKLIDQGVLRLTWDSTLKVIRPLE